jgi:putative membrane protein
MIWIPPFARVFVPAERRDGEVRQYAQALFLEHGLHRTRQRDGILVLVSLFERRVVVLADRGVSEKVSRTEFDAVIAAVATALSHTSLQDALVTGLDRLQDILAHHGFRTRAGDANELPDGVIQELGPT